jgi:hypothetical protein
VICSKNLQNIAQASSVHLPFLLSGVPQLDSEFSDLSLKALIVGLELTVLFNDLVDSFSTLCRLTRSLCVSAVASMMTVSWCVFLFVA